VRVFPNKLRKGGKENSEKIKLKETTILL